jgi:hypothetical protein
MQRRDPLSLSSIRKFTWLPPPLEHRQRSSLGLSTSCLLLLKKQKRKSHRIQVDRSNNRKQKEVYNLAHVWVTILVAEKRSKPEGDRRTTSQVIAQVVAEFKLHGLHVTFAKSTINKYVARGSIGLFQIARGYCGMIAPHIFCLLVLLVESKIQINQVNSGSPESATTSSAQ